MTVIQIGCSQHGLPNWVQQIVTGDDHRVRRRARSCVRSRQHVTAIAVRNLANRICRVRISLNRTRQLKIIRSISTFSIFRFPTSLDQGGHRRGAHRSRLLGGLRHPQDRRRTRRARPDVHDRPRQRGVRGRHRGVPASRRRPRRSTTSRRTSAGSGAASRGDSQLRWLGPEKGVIHLALAAIVNAVWDLYAKAEGKPVWKLLADMTPRAARVVHRLPLHHRRADAGRGARRCSSASARRKARARSRAAARRLSGLHDVGRLDRLLGREDPPAVPRGARRRLDALQGEGRRRDPKTTRGGSGSCARRSARTAS